MPKKIKQLDPDMPSGKLIPIPDFLPPPSELAKAKTRVLVTMGIDLEVLDFFRREAKKHGTKYQRMIRDLLRQYVQYHQKKAA